MAMVHEIKEYRNVSRVFKDRRDAGKQLGEMLKLYYGPGDEVIAIPSGGVPVGIETAKILECSFDMVIVRKMKIPGNPEAGFGAMTPDGTRFLNEGLLHQIELTREQVEAEAERVKKELEARNRLFRGDREIPEVTEKRVIIVDDGLASGYTLMAAVYMMRKRNVREIVVAVPTAPASTIAKIQSSVDAVYCINIREGLRFAVAEAYRNWKDLTDEEVLAMLKTFNSVPA